MTHTIEGQFCDTDKKLGFGVKLGVYAELEFTEHNGKLIAPDDWQQQLEQQYKGDWDSFEVIAKQGATGTWFSVGDYGASDEIIQLEREA